MKQIIIDGIAYNLVPTEDGLNICTLDGYQYSLGPESSKRMTWEEAVDWCKSIGNEYELPSREVLLMCYVNENIRTHFAAGNYWSSTEYSSTTAWNQNFGNGNQSTNVKGTSYDVRAVRRLPI